MMSAVKPSLRRLGPLLCLVLASVVLAPAPAQAAPYRRVEIGTSVQGRPIYAYQVGEEDAARTMIVLGQIHGDEPAGRRTAGAIRDHRPVTGITLWIVPTINPDGAVLKRRTNARGVDLNRNWGWNWAPSTRGSQTWSGPKAWSEPETVAMRKFLFNTDPTWVVGLHQPLYGVDTYRPKSRTLSDRLVASLGLPRKSFTCSGVCHGTMTGFVNNGTPAAANTVEYGRYPTNHFVTIRARNGLVSALGGRFG